MPLHGPTPVVVFRRRRVSFLLSLAIAVVALFPAAAASRPTSPSSTNDAPTAGAGKRWFGALTPTDAVAAELGSETTSSPPPSFRVVDLGSLGGSVSGYTGEPWDINNSGTVVGRAIKPGGAYRPFIYRRGDSAMTELTAVGGVFSWALGVSESDKVVGSNSVGTGSTSTRDAFLWEAGAVTNLGNLSGDLSQNWSAAYDVNVSGEAVGTDSSPRGGGEKAFYYDGAMHEMGPMSYGGTNLAFCQGGDINDGILVVGTCGTYASSVSRAFRYGKGTGNLFDLGSLLPGESTKAQAVNQSDAILGTSGSRQVVWVGGEINDLGPAFEYPGTDPDISDSGAVVGSYGSGDAQRGKLYANEQMYDLTSLLPAGSGYTILEPHAINSSGEIAARALAPNGEERAVVLTPTASVPIGQTYGGRWARNPTHEWSDPVNSATGAFTTSATDLSLAGIGVRFAMRRSYVSANGEVGILGKGWSTSLTMSLAIDPTTGDVLLKGDDGQQMAYVKKADGTFEVAPGAKATLTLTGGVYELVHDDQTHYRFDSSGRLTSAKDRNGRGLTFAYTGSELSTVTDSAGRNIALTYLNGRLSRVTLPDGRNVQYGYTGNLLTSVLDARGGTTTYEYDAGERLSKVIDQNQHTEVHNIYGPDGRVTEQYDANGNHSTFGWDPATQTATLTDARLKTWTDVYQSNVLQRSTDPLGNSTRYEYDTALNLTKVVDALGNALTMAYDARGNMLRRTAPSPLSYQEVWTYNAFNDPLTYQDGRGHQTDYEYDGSGNLTTVTGPDPDGTGPLVRPVTRYERDPAGTGQITSITDPRQKVTRLGYDPTTHDLVSRTTPLGGKTTLTYDAAGRLKTSVEPRGNVVGAQPSEYTTTYSYDNADHLTNVVSPDPDGAGPQTASTTQWSFDPVGNLQTFTDANNHATDYGYDLANRLTSVIAPDPDDAGPLLRPVTSYTYDEVGNLKTRTVAGNHTTTYAYDDANRLSSMTSPMGQVWTYIYDATGNRLTQVDASGNATPTAGDGQTTYRYDVLGRLTSIGYSDATPAVGYSYDANGNLTQMTDGSGTETAVYDPLNRLTSSTRGTATFAYAYDPAGNRTRTTYPDGTAVDAGYDDDGRLASVTSGGVTTSYGYDAAGNRITTTLPTGNGHVETRTYDRAGRMTGLTNRKGATTLSGFQLTLDPVGNPLTSVRTGATAETATFTYDGLDRLTGVCFKTSCPLANDPFVRWTYDSVGNRLTEARATGTKTYTYNAADQLTQAGATTYTYDQNGNQKTAGSATFAYDLENRLASTTTGTTTTTYTYDGLGRRQRAATGTTSAKVTKYLWDASGELPQIALERDGADRLLRRYVYGADRISMNTGTTTFYYHYDPLGSVVNLTSSTGASQWTHSYEPYGVMRTETKNNTKAPANFMKFVGEYLDPTGLYHLRVRQYDATTGRFLTLDPRPRKKPLPFTSSYVYAESQPTKLTDPSGLGAIGKVCTSIWCWFNDTALGNCYMGIGEGVALSIISAGTLTWAAASNAATGCAIGAGIHGIGEVAGEDVETVLDWGERGYGVGNALANRSERKAKERAARECRRQRSGGRVVIVVVIVVC